MPGDDEHQPASPIRFVPLDAGGRIPMLVDFIYGLCRAGDAGRVLEAVVAGIRGLCGPCCEITLDTTDLTAGEFRLLGVRGGDCPARIRTKCAPLIGGLFDSGVLSAIAATTQPKLAQHLTIRNDPVLGDHLAPFGSLVAIPLREPAGSLGPGWTILLRREPDGFDQGDLHRLLLRASLIGATVNNIAISRRLRESTARHSGSINRLAAVQRRLLPIDRPEIRGLEIAASYATFDRTGGDYHDFFPLRFQADGITPAEGTPWGLLIADASGHGPDAAVVVAMLHALVHSTSVSAKELPDPAAMLDRLNHRLFARRICDSFVTAFLAVYDPKTRALSYASAGHPPPLLRCGGPDAITVPLPLEAGVPLGVLDDLGCRGHSLVLSPGDSLLLYTDGILDAANSGRSRLGMEALTAAFRASPDEPDAAVRFLDDSVRRHEAGAPPTDDQTLVVVRAAA